MISRPATIKNLVEIRAIPEANYFLARLFFLAFFGAAFLATRFLVVFLTTRFLVVFLAVFFLGLEVFLATLVFFLGEALALRARVAMLED